MAGEKVLVFGPTGNVGSITAITAQELGAKVILAMRDTKKSIPGLSAEDEKAGNFERVQADLSDAESVEAAVKKTQVKRAFIYLCHGMQDHMKATIQSLKSAGIEFVVFLSSFTVIKDNMDDIPPSDMISYIHAQVEKNIQEIFGKENYVAVRPGNFASNTYRWADGVTSGEVKLPYPEATTDGISNLDMGRVSANILVKGKLANEYYVYLFGPQKITQGQTIETISKVLNKEVKITPLYGEDAVDLYKAHTPERIARYLVEAHKRNLEGEDWSSDTPWYADGQANCEKYTGKPPETYTQWVERNKQSFMA